MRVLITNQSLWFRSGTETYVRDLAKGLMRRGHEPVIFCTQLGEVADEIIAAGVPVIDDLARTPWQPDVLHGHHLLETSAAICRFPQTPAIFVCHDLTAWHDSPPKFPQIRRYIAVDDAIAARLVEQHAVPVDRVSVVRNAVDMERFLPRGPLPARPARALLFNNYAGPAELQELRAACAPRGIALDAVGDLLGGKHPEPEKLLRDYDLVFATGRSALEAMAVGAAVVLCTAGRSGPLMTSGILGSLATFHSGRRLLDQPFHREVLGEQIDSYSAEDASAVSKRIRRTRSLDGLVSLILDQYGAAIAERSAFTAADTLSRAGDQFAWWAREWRRILEENRPARATAALASVVEPEPAPQASTVATFDRPRRGWLPPEHDGRQWIAWIGPTLRADVEMLVPTPGKHLLRCQIAHVIKQSILEALQVEVEGQRIPCTRLANDRGVQIVGKLPDLAAAPATVRVRFIVPEVVRPCDINEESCDMRKLSLAFSEVSIIPK